MDTLGILIYVGAVSEIWLSKVSSMDFLKVVCNFIYCIMAMFDLVSDFVARINNGVRAGKNEIAVIKSKLIISICKKLVKLGYFTDFKEVDNEVIVVPTSKINKLIRVSKPGKRVYTTYKDFPKIVGGIGWNILTSSKGIVTNFEAKNEKVGGELLFQIY
jgi:small subunit ribosomal protein S8